MTGDAAIAGGRFADSATGLTLEKLDAQAAVSRDQVDVRRFSGTDGHAGTFSGSGVVSLTPDGGSSFQIQLGKFQLLDNELGRAVASGPVSVVRDAQGKARVVGRLRIVRAEITTKTPTPTGVVPLEVTEVNLPVRPGAEAAAGPARPAGSGLVALDVSLSAPGGVFVRGKGLDAELSLDAHVVGTTATPQLSGQARILRGSYDFSGKRFDLDPGGTVRLAARPEDIRLDLKAERDDPALDAVVTIRGSASRPEITLTSRPVLPQGRGAEPGAVRRLGLPALAVRGRRAGHRAGGAGHGRRLRRAGQPAPVRRAGPAWPWAAARVRAPASPAASTSAARSTWS